MSATRRSSPAFWKRLAAAVTAATILTPTLFTVGLAERYARAHTHPACPRPLFDSPADLGLPYEEVTLTARDGVQVPGWYIPGTNGAVIIAAPGFNGTRTHALSDFGFLAEAGYGLLVFAQRHCTDSGIPQTLGYNEARDMISAAQYLTTRPEVAHVGAIGFSAGGVTTILAAAQEPDIEAVVEAGGYYNLEADILDPQYEHGWYDAVLRRLIVGAFRRQTGVHPRQFSPIDAVDKISPRPLLLIYGQYEALSGQALYEAAGEPKDLWIVPGAGHGDYQTAAGDEYERRVVTFFDRHLLSTGEGAS